MWDKSLPDQYHVRKCRHRVATFCRGVGLDINPSGEKIIENAIGVGLKKSKIVDIELDTTAIDAFRVFADDSIDYIFSANQLGWLSEIDYTLDEYWRILKYGGHLILYEPDADYYPRVGTPGWKEDRRLDLYWEDAWKVLREKGNAELVSATRHNESNEYSWQLVIKKKFSVLKKPYEILKQISRDGLAVLPRKKKTQKDALLIRCGALGDTIWTTPVLSNLKKEGYHVVVLTNEYASQVLKENPNVDELIVHPQTLDIPYTELDDYWQKTAGKGFDKIINLSKSVEGALIKVEGSKEFTWPHEKRHAECDVNFQDRTMEVSGYPEDKGRLPELYFTQSEHHLAQILRNYYRDKFVILWSLSGSAFHKVYPWAEYVAREFINSHDDAIMITVGDELCKTLEWSTPRTVNKSGIFTVRQSFILTKYADLVIGPDTGLMNAASCFDTPKIIFMSANSIENLTKYWKNTVSLWAEDCECHPCHRLIYTNTCPKGTIQGIAPKCMEHIKPEKVLDAMNNFYWQWREKRVAKINKQKVAAFTIYGDDLTCHLAMRVANSFAHFHPDIPFYSFDMRDEKQIFGKVDNSVQAEHAFTIRPKLARKLLDDFETVIYLDADTVVTDRLDEFLGADFDVAGSLNIGNEESKFLNAGVCAVRNKQFCDEWMKAVLDKSCEKSNQPSFNKLAHSTRYNLKIVDEQNVYYNERSREYWKDLNVKFGRLWTNGRLVKVLHWAGGVSRMEQKLSSADFSEAVRAYLNDVTRTKDFTSYKGEEVSQWAKV